MSLQRRDILIAVASVLGSMILLWMIIPYTVAQPRSVHSIFLSPRFWPYILATSLLTCSVLLLAQSLLNVWQPLRSVAPSDDESASGGLWRILIFIVLLGAAYAAIRPLGMVWTTMLLFLAISLVCNRRTPVMTVIVAICLPLVLYFFFAKVAGVAIPQGVIQRLP